MDDHLDAINSNSDELQTLYEYQCILDSKIDKLLERIEHIELDRSTKQTSNPFPTLTGKERDILIVLYLAETPLALKDISQKVGLPRVVTSNILMSLIDRKVPLTRVDDGRTELFSLSEAFRSIQAKKDILGIASGKTSITTKN